MQISRLTETSAPDIAHLTLALTHEIMQNMGDTAATTFNQDYEQACLLCEAFIKTDKYMVFGAIDKGQLVGFASGCESWAIYANGKFGIIQECYVLPEYRNQGIGEQILEAFANYGRQVGWQRLELCTPPLPYFEKTVNFYQQNQFERTGGYKMKRLI